MPRRRHRSQGWKDRFLPALTVVGLTVYLGLNLARLLIQEGRLLGQGRIVSADRRDQDALSQKLIAEIADARSDQGVEHLARKVLGLARPGEVPVVFLPGGKAQLARVPVPPTPPPAPAPSPAPAR